MKKISLNSNKSNTVRDIMGGCSCYIGCVCDSATQIKINQYHHWANQARATAYTGTTPYNGNTSV